MKSIVAAIGIAALGGATAVFGAYDDAPGATLLGIALIVGALILGARSARSNPYGHPRPTDTTGSGSLEGGAVS